MLQYPTYCRLHKNQHYHRRYKIPDANSLFKFLLLLNFKRLLGGQPTDFNSCLHRCVRNLNILKTH